MSDKTNLTNSIWPNGIQKDADGYAVFYPLGTNKVEIPKNSPHWPKGNKLIGQFVYKDDKLVGFCDTKAMTATSGDIIVMPYETIDTEFDSIENGTIQIHAPKATVKKASWTNGGKVDIPDVEYKYKGCKDIFNIRHIDENYLENDIKEGCWNELLSSLEGSGGMFNGCKTLTSFTSDLSSLANGDNMFNNCENLTSFDADLSTLTRAYQMFNNCINLKTLKCQDLSSLTYGYQTFVNCSNLTSFTTDLDSVDNGFQMFMRCSNLATFTSDLSSLTTAKYMFCDCSNLLNFKSDLNSLDDGTYMFTNCTSLTSFDIDLDSLTVGDRMFHSCSNISSFTSSLKSLINGYTMFTNCKALESFNIDLSSVENGGSMFSGCSNLTSFHSDLISLKDGASMFRYCSNLSSFKCGNLDSLTNGDNMFQDCSNLTSFKYDLSSLETATFMFHSCSNLTSFKSKLGSLTNGNRMFNGCSLTTFEGNLKLLINGDVMFGGCKLDVSSVKNIIVTINTVSSETESPNILIGMGCNNNQTDKDLFAQEVGYSNMSTLLQTLQNKGWTVGAQYNGRPSTNYSLRQPESLPVFVKLVEVIPSEDENSFYEYTSQDNTKFYNLDWFHETTGSTDTYTQFSSLEEAITHFNIKQIEK